MKTEPDTSAESPPSAQYAAFISHASGDRAKALEICESLESRGLRCWIAPRDIRAGREYAEEIVSGIEQSRCLILVFSAASDASVMVRREVERAVSKAKPVFTVRLEEKLPSKALEFYVSSVHWIDAWEGMMDAHVERLARDLTDERVLAEGAGHSMRAARRRNLRPWLVPVAVCGLALAAVFIWNATGGKRHSRGYPGQAGYEAYGQEPARPIRQKDLKARLIPADYGRGFEIRLEAEQTILRQLAHSQVHVALAGQPFTQEGSMGSDGRIRLRSIDEAAFGKADPVKIQVRLESLSGGEFGPFEFEVDPATARLEMLKRNFQQNIESAITATRIPTVEEAIQPVLDKERPKIDEHRRLLAELEERLASLPPKEAQGSRLPDSIAYHKAHFRGITVNHLILLS